MYIVVCDVCIKVTMLCNTHEHILELSTYGAVSGMIGTRQQMKASSSNKKEAAMGCCITACSISK